MYEAPEPADFLTKFEEQKSQEYEKIAEKLFKHMLKVFQKHAKHREDLFICDMTCFTAVVLSNFLLAIKKVYRQENRISEFLDLWTDTKALFDETFENLLKKEKEA